MESQPSTLMVAVFFKEKWKARLKNALLESLKKLQAAQEPYKRNYDNRMRRAAEKINSDDQVYLRVERRDEKETRHKIAPIAQVPRQGSKNFFENSGNRIPWSLHGELFSITRGSRTGEERH